MQLSTSPTFDSIKATLSGACFCVLTSLCFGQTEPILRFAATANPYVQATGPRMNFTRVINDINALNTSSYPISLVTIAGEISGDLSIDSPPLTVDQEFENFLAQANQLEMPWKPAYGDHDDVLVNVGGMFRQRSTKYTQWTGFPEYYSFTVEGVKFIILSTLSRDMGGAPLGLDQYTWLQQELASATSASHVIVMSAEHGSGTGLDMSWRFQTAGNGTPDETYDLFEDEKIAMWLVGSSGESGRGFSAVRERNYVRVRTEALFSRAQYALIEVYADRLVISERDALTNTTRMVSTWPYNRAAGTLSAYPNTEADADIQVTAGSLVRLSGYRSRGLVGGTQTFTWSQISGPETVQLRPGARRTESWFFAKTPGTYLFRLTGTQAGLTSTDDLTVTVSSGPETTDIKTFTDIIASQDVWVNSDTSDDNAVQANGTASRLHFQKGDTSEVREAFLQFATPTTPFTRARLSLVVADTATGKWNVDPAQLQLHLLANDAWSETAMSWNNRPTGAGTLLGTQVVSHSMIVAPCPLLDITSTVQSQTDGLLTIRVRNAEVGPHKLAAIVSRDNAPWAPTIQLEVSKPRIVLSKNRALAEVGTPLPLAWHPRGGTSFNWSRVSGPASVVFTSDGTTAEGSALGHASFSQPGDYTLRASVTIDSEAVTEQHVVTVLPAGTDADADGLNDAWEYRHFGTTTAVGAASSDTDGDGLSLAMEQSLGTDPLRHDFSSASVLDGPPFVYRYSRSRSLGISPPAPRWSHDLSTWHAITSAPRVISQTPWSELVEVDLPAPLNGKLFCHLQIWQ
jgi:hypothetical protein